jgi:hypothetical protein
MWQTIKVWFLRKYYHFNALMDDLEQWLVQLPCKAAALDIICYHMPLPAAQQNAVH